MCGLGFCLPPADGTLLQVAAEKDLFRVVAAPTPAAGAGHQASGQDVAQHMLRALDLGAAADSCPCTPLSV